MDLENRFQVEILDHKIFEGHGSGVQSTIYFPKLGRIASCSRDNKIKVWDIDTSICVKTFSDVHCDIIRQLMIWNGDEGVFLSCGRDGRIVALSASKLERVKVIYDNHDSYFQKMIRISEDLFVCVEWGNEKPFIFSYSKSMLVRKLRNQSISVASKMINSKKHKDCYYFSSYHHSNYAVRMINYQEDEVVTDFKDISSVSSGIEIYSNERKEEILLVCNDGEVLFYNTCLKPITCVVKNVSLPKDSITSICVHEEKYIFLGTERNRKDMVYVLDISKDCQVVSMCPIKSRRIVQVQIIKVNNELHLLSSTNGGSVILSRVQGIEMKDPLEEIDLKSRLDYIWNECLDQIVFLGENSVKKRIVLLKIDMLEIFLYKSFL